MSNQNGLPRHWEVVKHSEIAEINPKLPFQNIDDETEVSFLPMKLVAEECNIIQLTEFRKYGEVKKGFTSFTNGDVIFAKITPCMENGKCAVVRDLRNGIGFGSTEFHVSRPKGSALPEFIFYFLVQQTFRRLAESNMTGSVGQKRVPTPFFRDFEIPLPPLAEQQRIVAKLEELFSELDAGLASLNTAARQLKTYRQAVLKWAFEEDKENYKPYLLKDIAQKIQIGPFGSQLHKEDYIEGGIPLINPMHIEDGRVVANNSYSITVLKRDSLPNYILEAGDVIMGRRGEMGRCGLVTEKEKGWFCGTGSLYVRPLSMTVDSAFLYYYLRSETVKKFLEENAGGTTMANLNAKIVNSVPVFLPSLEEQHRIVQEIESRLSVCEKLEETLAAAFKQAEALRQSILKQAFAGKLVAPILNPDGIQA